jgi:cystathionine gamma-synthase
MDFATKTIHAGQPSEPHTGAVVPPIFQTTTYQQEGPGEHRGFDYTRTNNPTRERLEGVLAELEGGTQAAVFGSGLAAEHAVLQAYLKPGEEIVVPGDVYGGTFRMLHKVFEPIGCVIRQVDFADPNQISNALSGATRLVWLESPTNPRLLVYDIAEISRRAHAGGALVVVDNTFATPFLQQPLTLGADVVVHAATTDLGGHSDVVGGFAATRDDELAERIGFLQNAAGAVPGPLDCYLVHRGAKTLPLRMARHSESAAAVADLLAGHPAVRRVLYPGRPDHPGHAVAARQMSAFGGMVSMQVAAGEAAALEVCRRTEVFTLAESLGAVESLIEHPGRMTHASVTGTGNEVPADLVRLSVGIEDVDDLLADLQQALDGLA